MQLLSSIVAASLRNRAVVVLLTLLLIVLGTSAALRLPMDAVPDVTNIQVQIITAAPALPPIEVEQYITTAVERAMAGLPKVTEIRSISKYGISVVTVVFTDDTSIYLARQLVTERMREAEEAVPAQYGRPAMGPISSGLGEVLQFVVHGEGHSLMEVEETLDWYIAPQLRTVAGITEVNSFGGENKEYQIVIDPARLQATGLSIREIIESLKRNNANAGGGYIEYNREQYVIGTSGLIHSLEDLRMVVIGATAQGVPISVGNLGEVRFGPRLRRGAASLDGKGEVAVGVAMMLLGENARTVTQACKAKLAALQPSLPPGIRVEAFYDRSALVNRVIQTVLHNLLVGAGLVILVLILVLGNLRAGLIVAVTIPLSMLFALVLMNLSGVSGNLMSLGAIDFGLIVDGAVIIVENAVRRLAQARAKQGTPLGKEQRVAVVREATIEVRSATVFGEAIIAIVYLPILSLSGVEGKLFRPMALTVLFALIGALVLSLTLVPVLCSLLLNAEKTEHEGRLMRAAQAAYAPLLGASLRFRKTALLVGALVLLFGLLLLSHLGAEFVPQLDEGDLLVEARRLPGISLSESVATDDRMQKAILSLPEVAHVVSRTGAPEVITDPMGIEQSDVYVILKPPSHWPRGVTKEHIAAALTRILGEQVPEVAVAISQPIQMRTNELVAGVRSDVAVQLYGPDLNRLHTAGEQIAAALSQVPGAVDVRVEQTTGLSYLRILPNRAQLARYGLTVEDINLLTETLAVGHTVGSVFEGDRRFGMVVKMGARFAGELQVYAALPLKSATGQIVPLGDVASLAIETGPTLVNREQLSRRLVVEFNVRGSDLVSVVAQAQDAVARRVRLPAGYRLEWGGQYLHFTEARDRLAWVVPLSLGLILFLLWLALGAVIPTLLIFCNIPFAVVGGVLALWLRQIPLSISAGVGFIALFGVAVLNGLVLVTFSRRLEAEGATPAAAIQQAAQLRLRPVLMTALVASLGFLPMALSHAPGSEVQRPLASVVIGGLLTATALTLLLFPAMYQLVYARKKPS